MLQKQKEKNFQSVNILKGSQSKLSAAPAINDRQTSQESHLHHCVLADLKEYHYGPFPIIAPVCHGQAVPPAFPLDSLDAILFTAGWQKEYLHECCRSVTAPRLRLLKTANVSGLLDMAGGTS